MSCPVDHGKLAAPVDAAPAVCPVNHGKPIVDATPAVCPVNHGKPIAPIDAPAVCPVNHGKANATPVDAAPAVCPVNHGKDMSAMMPPNHPTGFEGMDISMCPVHGGKDGKSNEIFMKHAKYALELEEHAAMEKLREQHRAMKHIASDQFLQGAPRFEVAKPVETSGTDVVGDVFPDSKPLFGQRMALSTAPAKSSIPKSERSKPLPALQLPEGAPQVPDNLKQAAHQAQELVCTSDTMGPVSPEAMLPGKDYKEDTWTFPSHQRFYNAMKKKGWNPNEMDIPYIVSIHNTVNQQVWSRIMQYERYHPSCTTPTLLKFQGRPHDLSPKAKILTTIGYAAPYDRHDWTVDRCGKDVRYVIDFYDGPQRPDAPVSTHLDVRPALDSPSAYVDRLRRYVDEFFEM